MTTKPDLRTPENVTCKICGRVGRVGFRTGYQDGTWLCIVRKACTRRARLRKRR